MNGFEIMHHEVIKLTKLDTFFRKYVCNGSLLCNWLLYKAVRVGDHFALTLVICPTTNGPTLILRVNNWEVSN